MVSTLIPSEPAGAPSRALVHVGLVDADGWGVRQRVPTLDLITVNGSGTTLDGAAPLPAGGRGALDVVIGMRPLWHHLPARYQSLVDEGLAEPFVAWVERLIDGHPHTGLDHVRVISAWNERSGAEHVHVVIDPTGVDRVAEVVAGLAGTAAAAEDPAGGRTGMRSAAAVEVRRRLNEAMHAPGSEVTPESVRVIEAHLAELPDAGPDDPPLAVPAHLVERLRPICEQAVACIGSSGNPVVGALSDLLPPPPGSAADVDDEPSLAIDEAARLVHRLLLVDPISASRPG